MKQSRVSGFFSPTIWLSGQLSFSRKYMLIGVVVLLALTSLSVPLLQQAREDSQFARLEREGLKQYVSQANALAAMVTLRSQAVSDRPGQTSVTPQTLSAAIDSLIINARKAGMEDHAVRLERSWAQARNLDKQEDPQRRFAALTGSVNALLSLILQSARIHRLNVDPELDATFDMLANRLPLVLETLAKQQDALTLKNSEMASYALGAQVVLTESVPGLKAGIARLVAINPASAPLKQALTQFLARITQQQDVADKTLDDPDAIDELRGLATSNVDFARKLLNDSVITADGYLLARIDRLQRTQWVIAGLLIFAISAIAYLFAGIYLSTLRSLKSLSEGTDAFCGGRLDTRIKIDTKDELVLVARNFNTLAKEFSGLLDVIREQNESRERELETLVQARTSELAEKNEQLSAVGERVQEELNLARNMQLAILPQHFPDNAELSVHASMFPARELGGDFYDCFPLADGRYGVLVADVSGKGVGAAFFMAVSRTVLLDLAMTGDSPAQIFTRANELLCERNPMELFVTACYAIYTPRDGQLIYASAGHHPPLTRRFSGNVEALHCPMDIALGVMPGMTYSDHSTILKQGDTLLLYTDGVTEAFDAHNEAYGDARLHDWLAAAAGDEASSLIAGLVGNVAEFVGDAEASDDLTCLALCRKQGAHDLDMPNTLELKNKALLLDYQMPSRLEEIASLAEAVEGVLPERQDLAFSANLCLEELITNTIQHGLNGASDRIVNVRISISDEWLEIILKDDAPPFDPFAEAPQPDIDLAIDERPIGGLGVHMVKMMMDDARTYYDGSGNLIVLLKTLKR